MTSPNLFTSTANPLPTSFALTAFPLLTVGDILPDPLFPTYTMNPKRDRRGGPALQAARGREQTIANSVGFLHEPEEIEYSGTTKWFSSIKGGHSSGVQQEPEESKYSG